MKSPIHFLKKIFSSLQKSKMNEEFIVELDDNIVFLQDTLGDEPHLRRAEKALQFLLDHPEEAHSRLIDLLVNYKAMSPTAIIQALPKFGRPESVPVLEKIMSEGDERLSEVAASSLARHPHESAFNALLRGLSFPRNESIIAAADGLYSRGNSSACSELLKKIEHRDDIVRYHVIQAAAKLGCLTKKKLLIITRHDPDAEIRSLAIKYIKNG